jgi:hypothetical protein
VKAVEFVRKITPSFNIDDDDDDDVVLYVKFIYMSSTSNQRNGLNSSQLILSIIWDYRLFTKSINFCDRRIYLHSNDFQNRM